MSLKFPELSDATRDKISHMIQTRALTDRARRFLTLALDAVESTPPSGMRCQWFGNAILVSGDQQRLADLIAPCSVKTFQRAIAGCSVDDSADTPGEFAEFLKADKVIVRTESGLPIQRLVYAILIDQLEAMPAIDPTDEFEAFAMRFGPGLVDLRSNVVRDVASDVVRDVVRDVASQHAHEHEHALIQKTHAHEHEHDHESCRSLDLESQESQPGEESGERQGVSPPSSLLGDSISFSQIQPDHVKRIVRQSDAVLFGRYFDDAVSAGWARDCLADRVRMAGLFHQVIRVAKAKNIGATIAGAWKNRDSPEKTKRGKPKALILSQEDEDFASKLLRPSCERRVASGEIRNPLKVLPSVEGDDVSPAELARCNAVRAANLKVLLEAGKR